ncbi:MAG TPA: hypothetical protein VFA68_06835 [Terriglobales bacterium]|nr:hypothetical protein [Terriglobales bacterium]
MEQPNAANSQSPSHEPKTTGVLVLLKAKPGVTREQVMKIMPTEIRATVRLYLDGMIRQWFSRSDGKGVVLILDCKDVAEAHALMDELPLSAENLMDHEYIPVGPLMPLRALMGPAAQQ